jgi:phenylacetate 2-hydroxylase
MPIIDLESTASIKELVQDADNLVTEKQAGEVDPNAYFARFALNTSLTLNYGFRISGNVSAPLLKEITHVEREVSNLRSTSNNWQDYVPLMRLWPGGKNAQAGEYRERRDVYMGKLLDMLKEKIASGTDTPCITGNILKDPEAKLNDGTCHLSLVKLFERN